MTPLTQSGGSDSASGWSVHRTWHGWQWSAYGPGGMDVGTALTKASAERKAQERERFLRLPVFNVAGRAVELPRWWS